MWTSVPSGIDAGGAAIMVQLMLLGCQEDPISIKDTMVLQVPTVYAQKVARANLCQHPPSSPPQSYPLPWRQRWPWCEVGHEDTGHTGSRWDGEQDDTEVEGILEDDPTRGCEVKEAIHVGRRSKWCLCSHGCQWAVCSNAHCTPQEPRTFDVPLTLQTREERFKVSHELHAVACNHMLAPEVANPVVGELQMTGVNQILKKDIVSIWQVTHVKVWLPLPCLNTLPQGTGNGKRLLG
mmetsp:Transcript_104815/g.262570  ORF Transcript_104815/g.262570 Transcript_104815/m.262570 type:complete len:237 (-) Transcript_104815:42-752(-)